MEKGAIKKAMIIDLDFHRGNGYETDKINKKISENEEDVFIIDVFKTRCIFDDYVEIGINLAKNYNGDVEDDEYLENLENLLKDEKTLKFGADIIYYNAGTDIYVKDPLSTFSISKEGIIKRDELVFKFAFENKIPICMVLSGGYSKESHEIVSKSIENLFKVFNLDKTIIFE